MYMFNEMHKISIYISIEDLEQRLDWSYYLRAEFRVSYLTFRATVLSVLFQKLSSGINKIRTDTMSTLVLYMIIID